jgi:hypothetical protein
MGIEMRSGYLGVTLWANYNFTKSRSSSAQTPVSGLWLPDNTMKIKEQTSKEDALPSSPGTDQKNPSRRMVEKNLSPDAEKGFPRFFDSKSQLICQGG